MRGFTSPRGRQAGRAVEDGEAGGAVQGVFKPLSTWTPERGGGRLGPYLGGIRVCAPFGDLTAPGTSPPQFHPCGLQPEGGLEASAALLQLPWKSSSHSCHPSPGRAPGRLSRRAQSLTHKVLGPAPPRAPPLQEGLLSPLNAGTSCPLIPAAQRPRAGHCSLGCWPCSARNGLSQRLLDLRPAEDAE